MLDGVVCRMCGDEAHPNFILKSGEAYCINCAKEEGLVCMMEDCENRAFLTVAEEGPMCRDCFIEMCKTCYVDAFMDTIGGELDEEEKEIELEKDYRVVSIYFAYAHHHLIVPSRMPDDTVEETVDELRDMLRIAPGLTRGRVKLETWQGLELLEEWATYYEASSPVRKVFGVLYEGIEEDYKE